MQEKGLAWEDVEDEEKGVEEDAEEEEKEEEGWILGETSGLGCEEV